MRSLFLLSLLASPALQATCFQPKLPELKSTNTPAVVLAGNHAKCLPTRRPTSIINQSTRQWASAADEGVSSEIAELDVEAMFKYGGALAIQMALFTGLFFGLDQVVAGLDVQVPFAVNFVLFYFCAFKSRVLNPLNNNRPNTGTKEIGDAPKRRMPTWTPPGFIFPIVWLLLIGPLRAYTTALIYSVNGGQYASFAILSLMFHLSIGDVWNTINNVERRYGTSVLGIACVYTSAAFAAYSYYQVLPLAGQLLSLKMIWLTIASSLVLQTWRLNPNPKTGEKYSLLPRKEGDAKTEFLWF